MVEDENEGAEEGAEADAEANDVEDMNVEDNSFDYWVDNGGQVEEDTEHVHRVDTPDVMLVDMETETRADVEDMEGIRHMQGDVPCVAVEKNAPSSFSSMHHHYSHNRAEEDVANMAHENDRPI